MNDRDLMENILLLEKGVCDLYMHGAIESSSSDVHQTFSQSLNTALNIQDQIYNQMQEKGWYQTQQVDQSKINSLKMKFTSNSNQ